MKKKATETKYCTVREMQQALLNAGWIWHGHTKTWASPSLGSFNSIAGAYAVLTGAPLMSVRRLNADGSSVFLGAFSDSVDLSKFLPKLPPFKPDPFSICLRALELEKRRHLADRAGDPEYHDACIKDLQRGIHELAFRTKREISCPIHPGYKGLKEPYSHHPECDCQRIWELKNKT